jgi:hypothetical protein
MLLLARHDLRRKSGHKVMRSLPEVFSMLGKPFAIHKANCPHVAPSALGPGHCRATTHGPREPQIHLRRRRVFYQMDRGEGSITITSKTAQKFFWQNIVCRFGVPSELTVDNGKQFDSQDFRDFCFSIGTKLAFALVYHPQSNGVVERANGKIFTAIKKMLLDDKKGKWADLLPEAVWALNMTECWATRFTPFRLLYGSEAMTPQEIKHGSPRTSASAVPDVDEPTSKDLIDGDRVFALQALDKYQAQTKAWRDHVVVPREFNEGDRVLVRTTRTESRGKLESKWEGPFIIKTKSSPSAYRLRTQSGEDLEHSWNIDNLRKFFV